MPSANLICEGKPPCRLASWREARGRHATRAVPGLRLGHAGRELQPHAAVATRREAKDQGAGNVVLGVIVGIGHQLDRHVLPGGSGRSPHSRRFDRQIAPLGRSREINVCHDQAVCGRLLYDQQHFVAPHEDRTGQKDDCHQQETTQTRHADHPCLSQQPGNEYDLIARGFVSLTTSLILQPGERQIQTVPGKRREGYRGGSEVRGRDSGRPGKELQCLRPLERPYATLQRAQQAARQAKGREPVTIYLRGGTHYLTDTLILTAEDSGTPTAPVVYQAYRNEQMVISGGVRLKGLKWAGINIGDGCWGGHVIEFCDIFDTVKETGDHGSFNSWGRDRFWGLDGLNLNDDKVWEAEKDVPLLDAVKTVMIRNNRWRCDHGWDIDLDDGSTNYHIYNNLCLHGGLKNREGFHRMVENNIIVNNGFHPHVWYKHSQDVFRRNIIGSEGYLPGRRHALDALGQGNGLQPRPPARRGAAKAGSRAGPAVASAMRTPSSPTRCSSTRPAATSE